jgi:hypothetical protein
MTAQKKDEKLPPRLTPMALVQLGYDKYVFPVATAAKIIELLSEGEYYETEWVPKEKNDGINSRTDHFIDRNRPPKTTMELMNGHTYVEAALRGPKRGSND